MNKIKKKIIIKWENRKKTKILINTKNEPTRGQTNDKTKKETEKRIIEVLRKAEILMSRHWNAGRMGIELQCLD